MAEQAIEQDQRDNESGMDDCELDHYENQKVCYFCGKDMVESYISCCGEVYFDTQKNLDLIDKEDIK